MDFWNFLYLTMRDGWYQGGEEFKEWLGVYSLLSNFLEELEENWLFFPTP